MRQLRAGVAGAGVFGGFHARKYAELPGVALAGVFDPHGERARAAAEPLGGRGFDDLTALLAEIDVLTVAAPAAAHAELALAALAAGKAVYVEKPLAVTLDQADRLVAEAARRGLVLACGHQERTVFAAMGLLAVEERPVAVEAVRLGTPSDRNRDVSCVLDLMIHDLDLALQLARSEPLAVEAEGGFDHVRAEVTFETGYAAVLEASRAAPARSRTMRVLYGSGAVEVDFLAPSFRNGSTHPLDAAFAQSPAGRDPLGVSVAAFLAAVRGDAPRPAVTGPEAARALDLALAVEHAAGL